MARSANPQRSAELSAFANRVLLRTRSGTGVAVYKGRDGEWSFVCTPEAVAVTLTSNRAASFSLPCRRCGVTVAACALAAGGSIATPCLCGGEEALPPPGVLEASVLPPEGDFDVFSATVLVELTRREPFVLFGMVRGFLKRYWRAMGRRPDPALWAGFYRVGWR